MSLRKIKVEVIKEIQKEEYIRTEDIAKALGISMDVWYNYCFKRVLPNKCVNLLADFLHIDKEKLIDKDQLDEKEKVVKNSWPLLFAHFYFAKMGFYKNCVILYKEIK